MANSCHISTKKSKALKKIHGNLFKSSIEDKVFLSYMEDAKTLFGKDPEQEEDVVKASFQILIAKEIAAFAEKTQMTDAEKGSLAKMLFDRLPLNLSDPYNNNKLEVSTAGDDLGRQFSAFFAKFDKDTEITYLDYNNNPQTIRIKEGDTVEDVYQRAKGYPTAEEGKGKKPKVGSPVYNATYNLINNDMLTSEATFLTVYLPIWIAWAEQQGKQDVLGQLWKESLEKSIPLSDKFASKSGVPNPVNQARALTAILTARFATPKEKDMESVLNDIRKGTASASRQKTAAGTEQEKAEREEAEKNKKRLEAEKKQIRQMTEASKETAKLFASRQKMNVIHSLADLFSFAVDSTRDTKIEELDKEITDLRGKSKGKKSDLTTSLSLLDKISYLNGLQTGDPAARLRLIREVGGGKIIAAVYNLLNSVAQAEDKDLYGWVLSLQRYECTDEEVMEYADALGDEWKRQAKDMQNFYKKIVENKSIFLYLMTQAMPGIRTREMISFNVILSEDTETSEETDDDTDIEENSAEAWVEDKEAKSAASSVSQYTVATLYMLQDRKKETDEDTGETYYDSVINEMGLPSYVPVETSVNVLLNAFEDITEEDEMDGVLERLRETYPWIQSLMEVMESDPTFKTALWQNFRNDRRLYWREYASAKGANPTNPGLRIRTSSRPINSRPALSSFVRLWKKNMSEGRILNQKMSIYDRNGRIIQSRVKEVAERLGRLRKEAMKGSGSARIQYVKEHFQEIKDCFMACGIQIEDDDIFLANLIAIRKEKKGISHAWQRIMAPTIIYSLQSFLERPDGMTGAQKPYIKDNVLGHSIIDAKDKRMDTLAQFVYSESGDAMESSAFVAGKPRYTMQKPSYITTLLKRLRKQDKFTIAQFLQKNYGKYSWFYDSQTQTWMSTWLDEINKQGAQSEGASDSGASACVGDKGLLHHKILAENHEGKMYGEWSSLDHLLAFITEYFNFSGVSTGFDTAAYYPVPTVSDVDQAQFISFKKYSYKEVIDGLVLTALQELRRINIVNERTEKIKKGEIEPIANFDISYNSDGSIRSKGGSEFKFLAFLNDSLEEIQKKNADELEDYLREKIERGMEDLFAKEYAEYARLGLFEENDLIGGYRYFGEDPAVMGADRMKDNPVKTPRMAREAYIQSLKKLQQTIPGKKDDIQYIIDAINNGNEETSSARERLRRLARDLAPRFQEGSLTKDNCGFSSAEEIMNEKGRSTNTTASYARANSFDRGLYEDLLRTRLRDFFYNSVLASINIIELLETDLAFFPNANEYVKRNKQIYASGSRLFTGAQWMHADGKVENVGRTHERSITIADEKIVSQSMEEIKKTVQTAVQENRLSGTDAAHILAAYGYQGTLGTDGYADDSSGYCTVGKARAKTKKINVTDGQAYRSLDSYRRIMIMCESLKWSNRLEEAYQRIKKGEIASDDLTLFLQALKPFVYTQVEKDAHTAAGDKLKVPIQRKNSESVLLVVYDAVAQSLGNASRLRAINQFMLDNDIDTVQFVSCVKVGGQGVINLNSAQTEEDIKTILEQAIKDKDGKENPDVVHTTPYEDYMIQVEEPESHLDKKELLGTQMTKLITVDMEDDMEVEVNGEKYKKKDLFNLFQNTLAETVIQHYQELREIFGDPTRIASIIMSQFLNGRVTDTDIVEACMPDANGKFSWPLDDPLISRRIQSAILSLCRDYLQRLKTDGASLIQISCWGKSDDLKIKFKDDGGIEYMECYMPATSKKYFEALMDENGNLNVNKLPEELRRCIGYRLPTEHLSSIWPLRIKGFLPANNGSAIMLPAEITTISGTDFDVDKTTVMLPAFYVTKKGEVRKVKPNMSKPLSKMSEKERNNLMLDIIWSILTHKNTAVKILNPGGYDAHKTGARVMDVLSVVDKDTLCEEMGVKKGSYISAIKKLREMDVDVLQELYDRLSESTSSANITTPSSALYYRRQNMNAKKLIGVYATANAAISLLQHTDISLTQFATKKINLFGKITGDTASLHEMKNKDLRSITKMMAGYLGASVDNAKDPLLASLNQNMLTVNVTILLTTLGYSPMEIGAFLSQPVIRRMGELWLTGRYKTTGEAIDAAIAEYSYQTVPGGSVYHREMKRWNTMDTAMYCLLMERSDMDDNQKESFRNIQASYGDLFKQIYSVANEFSSVIQGLRSGAYRGTVGKSFGKTFLRQQSGDRLISSSESIRADKLVNGTNNILPSHQVDYEDFRTTFFTDPDMQRQVFKKSDLPSQAAFFTMCFRGVYDLLKDIFPQAGAKFRNDVMNCLKGAMPRSPKEEEINMFADEFTAWYICQNVDFFKRGPNPDAKVKDAAYYMNEFPDDLAKFLSLSEEEFRKKYTDHQQKDLFQEDLEAANSSRYNRIMDNPLLRLLYVDNTKVYGTNKTYKTVNIDRVGGLSSTQKDILRGAWEELYDDPITRELAQDLFLYCFYRNGLTASGTSFIHLAPLKLRMEISGYRDRLKDLQKGIKADSYGFDEDDFLHFRTIFILNHPSLFAVEVPGILLKKYEGNPDFSPMLIDSKKGEITIPHTIDPWNSKFPARIKDAFFKQIKRWNPTWNNGNGAYMTEYVPRALVTFMQDGKRVYYILESASDGMFPRSASMENPATYQKVSLLGEEGFFLELQGDGSLGNVKTSLKSLEQDPAALQGPNSQSRTPANDAEAAALQNAALQSQGVQSAGEHMIITSDMILDGDPEDFVGYTPEAPSYNPVPPSDPGSSAAVRDFNDKDKKDVCDDNGDKLCK